MTRRLIHDVSALLILLLLGASLELSQRAGQALLHAARAADDAICSSATACPLGAAISRAEVERPASRELCENCEAAR